MSSKINLQTCEYACKSSIFQDNQLIYEEISTLTYDDYCYGPVPDNRPNYADESIWVFKKKVDWLMIYIKLEIVSCNGKRLVVLSFHEDNAQ